MGRKEAAPSPTQANLIEQEGEEAYAKIQQVLDSTGTLLECVGC